MNINLEKYYITQLKDYNNNTIDLIILLNKKHSINEFQKAINDAKDNHYEDIQENGDDWYYISQELENFDYIEIALNDFHNNVVYY